MLRLRPLESSDLGFLHGLRSDSDIACGFFAWRPITQSQQEKWYDSAMKDLAKVLFIAEIVRLETVEPHGRIGFCQVADIDHRNGTAEVGGFMISKSSQGRGYGSKMIDMLVEFCFNDIGLRKLYLEVFANNIAVGVYKKLGFMIEGTLKEHVWKSGCWQDVLIMSKFRE